MSDKHNLNLNKLNKAIELNPESADYYHTRALIYFSQKIYEKALKDTNKAIELNPESADYYHTRGLIYAYQGVSEKALKDINKAIKLNPKMYMYYRARGAVYQFQKEYKKALTDYMVSDQLFREAKSNSEEFSIFPKIASSDHDGRELLLDLLQTIESLTGEIRKSKPNQPQEEVFHYTSDKVLKSIFNNGLCFYDVKYLNDILEGTVFFDLLQINPEKKKKIETLLFSRNLSSNYSICIGSFTVSEGGDDADAGTISMWRTYGNGGGGNRAAGGGMLCWKRDMFLKKTPDLKFGSSTYNSEYIEKDELFLLPVIYADSLDELEKDAVLEKVSKYCKDIGEILGKILDLHDHDSRKECDDINQDLIACTKIMMDKIRFLFKSKQYSYEMEERIVVFRSLGTVGVDETTEEQNVPGRFHIKSNPLSFTPYKLVLGPTNTRVDEWDEYLSRFKKEVKVKKSKIKFRESA